LNGTFFADAYTEVLFMDEMKASVVGGASVAWANVMSFAPKFLLFLVVLIGGYFLAKFLAKMFDRLLERLRFDDLVERGGVKRVLAKSGYDASDVLAKLLFYGLFLFVLQFAFGIFGPNPISDLLTRVIAYIPNIFAAAIIVIIASAIAKGIKDILGVSLGGVSYGQMLAKAAGAAVLVVGIFAALDQLGIAPNIVRGLFYATLAVIAGSAIVAIGGGGIKPMQARWERALGKVEAEGPRVISEAAAKAPEAARQKMAEAGARAEQWTSQAEDRARSAEFRPHDNV
jgi:MFS family permease